MKFWLFFILLFFNSFLPKAQLCNSNLGDPIVNVTFGTKADKHIPNLTAYTYVRGCPSKAQFTINDFLFGCGGYWVQMTGDHTLGDVDGNYMLIDAENTPGIIHQDTANNLCSGTTYQFSAFVTNVMQDHLTCSSTVVLPNLTFSVESMQGSVLATYNTGDIPITNVKQWVQYGFTFQTPANINTVILKITANSKDGCGNAFAIDDITLAACGPTVNIAIDGSANDQRVCADYTNPFIAQGVYSAGFTNPAVQWQNSLDTGKTWNDIAGATSATYAIPHRDSGVVLLRMVVAEKQNIQSVNCRIPSNDIYTEVHPVPAHNTPQNVNACTETDYSLPIGDNYAVTWNWVGPNGFTSNVQNPVIQKFEYPDTGLYKLTQTFPWGCITLDTIYVHAVKGAALSIQPPYPICEGMSEKLFASASDSVGFKWTPAFGLASDTIADPVAHPFDTTEYKVVITNKFGCRDSAWLQINVHRNPVANAGADKTIVTGDSAILNATVKGTAINYYWSPPVAINDMSAIQPTVFPSQNITYTLHAISTVGCGSASDDVNVKVYQDVFIPNSFTPNGDGKNDRFRIMPYENYQVKKFLIYNRWGKIIYTSATASEGWDGTYGGIPQPTGTYIYYVELVHINGKKLAKQGTLLLLR